MSHYGTAVACPICGHHFRRFQDAENRSRALCWRCGAHERHRALALFLRQRPDLLEHTSTMLHFAPEACIRRLVDPKLTDHHFSYLTADLDPTGVDIATDITDMSAVSDSAFDAIICSHVLEHVEDDRAAMRELRRITSPTGWCLIMVPLDLERDQTFEDWTITTPEARERAFWQRDHVRVYARDLETRLTDSGFSVQVISPEQWGPEEIERYGLVKADLIWLCLPAS